MPDRDAPREQIGPYTVDWIGPLVDAARTVSLALAPYCTAPVEAWREDVALIDRLLKETARVQTEGRVYGGRTGVSLIAALARVLTTIREDLAAKLASGAVGADFVSEFGEMVENLAGLIENLGHAIRTIEVELKDPDPDVAPGTGSL